ncbi:MAG: hypothetical protein AABY86_13705, partial [Bdellovibrionota bacterium]
AITGLLQTSSSQSYDSRPSRLLLEILYGAILIIGLYFYPFIPPNVRELALWGIVLGISVALLFRFNFLLSRHAAEIVLILLGIGSLAAFKERVPRFEPGETLLSIAEEVGNHVRSFRPALNSSLTRAKVDFQIGGLSLNTSQSMGISSIDGYWNPLVRFMKLVASLEGKPLERTINSYQFPSDSNLFKNLSQLYNVQYVIKHGGNNISVIPTGSTAGPAWFSGSVELLPSFEQLGKALNRTGDQIFRRAHEVAWILTDDPIIQKMKGPTQIAPACSTSKVLDVKAPLRGQSVRIAVQNASLCPLTLSMNFSILLKAYSLNEGKKKQDLELFPTYGTLAGIWVPPGVKEILVEPMPNQSIFSEASFYAGWGLLLLVLIILAKTKEEIEPTPHSTQNKRHTNPKRKIE